MKMDRRTFVNNIAKAGLGVSALSIDKRLAISQDKAKAKNVIYIYMEGGMSHLDTFDPKEDSETKGEFSKIATSADDMFISEHLSGLAKHGDKMAIVRSMMVGTGAHAQAQYNARTSYRPVGTIIHPSMGSWMSWLKPTEGTLPGNVIISGPAKHPGSGWLPKKHSPVPVIDPSKGLQYSDIKDMNMFKSRWEILNKINKNVNDNSTSPEVRAYVEFYDETMKLLQSSELDKFNIANEDAATREKYGNDRFGQGCLLARRLVESGVSFIELKSGGWDTHVNNFESLSNKLPSHDKSITALIEDLEQRGLLESTLIVIATEFGRTPKINVNNGRDHFPGAFSCAMIGAGVKGGEVFGETNDQGTKIISERKVEPKDFNATIATIAGLSVDQTYFSPTGRPFKVAGGGSPVLDIIA
jgi:hypothetical protein